MYTVLYSIHFKYSFASHTPNMHVFGLWEEARVTWKKHPNSTQKSLSQDLNQELSHNPITNLRFVPKPSLKVRSGLGSVCVPYMTTPMLFYYYTVCRFMGLTPKTSRWLSLSNLCKCGGNSSHDSVKVPSEVCYHCPIKKTTRWRVFLCDGFFIYFSPFPCLLKIHNFFLDTQNMD